ncbi:CAAX protease self-immunity [Paenibacillus sophorae]|uniref:CAAX protease self-immunity n=1 Tax=Paenibacillus sophorae TaxID=1333845 RepID=A0A1H8QEU1_9BACL|nr:type II CAAX endopeptidase family protein [Paenibacillus sophorae]QWU15152.1 CPBP family intramembrane metalloprotease [Paenibacillus sophorae]SEO52576.1 CAAX protease self-immunity [Paenibacillus sophorae]
MNPRLSSNQRQSNSKLILFLFVAFGFSWACWLPLLANKQLAADLPVLPGQFYLGSFGPLVGAVAAEITPGGKGFSAWIKTLFSFSFPRRWLLISSGLPLTYGCIAILAHRLVTGSFPEMHRFGLTSDLPAGFNIWETSLVWMLTFGIGEESGWRGFLLPELHRRHALFTSALIVAAIWMFWHLPAFWFNDNYLGMGFGIIGWGISLAYGSVVLAWICAGSRWSIIPVILWHGIFDTLTASDLAGQVMAMACSMLVILHGIVLMRKLGRRGAQP